MNEAVAEESNENMIKTNKIIPLVRISSSRITTRIVKMVYFVLEEEKL